MFPIRDHNPSERTPFVTYALLAANVAIFLLYWPLFNDERALLMFYDVWALRPVEVMHGVDVHTVLTSMFLHGGIMHLGGNMLFLWIFGDNLEEQMGHIPFLLFYLACGLAAALGQVAADPASGVPMVGASGAIAGVMGGYLLLFPRAQVDVMLFLVIIAKVISLPAWVMLGVWFGLQLFNGVNVQDASGGGVAYWAHAWGFVAGLGLCVPLWLRLGGVGYWAKTHGHPSHPEVVYSRTNLPHVRRQK